MPCLASCIHLPTIPRSLASPYSRCRHGRGRSLHEYEVTSVLLLVRLKSYVVCLWLPAYLANLLIPRSTLSRHPPHKTHGKGSMRVTSISSRCHSVSNLFLSFYYEVSHLQCRGQRQTTQWVTEYSNSLVGMSSSLHHALCYSILSSPPLFRRPKS